MPTTLRRCLVLALALFAGSAQSQERARAASVPLACKKPAPYLPSQPRVENEYIVLFRKGPGRNVKASTAALEAKYGFKAKTLFDMPSLKGFHAEVPPAVLSALRCEPGVESVHDNAVTRLDPVWQ
jgi:hypothetical protein